MTQSERLRELLREMAKDPRLPQHMDRGRMVCELQKSDPAALLAGADALDTIEAFHAKWCKEGESIDERMEREQKDTDAMLGLLAEAKDRLAKAESQLAESTEAVETLRRALEGVKADCPQDESCRCQLIHAALRVTAAEE